jgi:hypothetical protein
MAMIYKRFFRFASCAAVFVGLGVMSSGPAAALDFGFNFSIDETCNGDALCSGLSNTVTDIDHIGISYTAVIDQDVVGAPLSGNDPFTEAGYVYWTSYVDDGGNLLTPYGLNALGGYEVYGIFSGAGTAFFNGTEIEVTFSSFSISFYIDNAFDQVLSLDTTDGAIGVNAGAAIDPNELLFSATLLVTGEAQTGTTLAEGNWEVILTDLGLSALGGFFLYDPNPFYEFMNLAGNVQNAEIVTGVSVFDPNGFVATQGGNGQLFFIPEPGTLTLLGFGLLGLAVFRRRRHRA